MIGSVVAALAERRLVRPEQHVRFNITITRGATFAVEVFTSDRLFFHVKTSELLDLKPRYDLSANAWTLFGDVVPQPLGYVSRDGWGISIHEGVLHRPVTADFNGFSKRVRSRIVGFFKSASERARTTKYDSLFEFEILGQHFSGSPYTDVIEPWVTAEGRRTLGALRPSQQHGDFAINNLGYARSRLIVFDWEDFGKVTLPGFDVWTLFMSAVQFDLREIRIMMSPTKCKQNSYFPLLHEACEAIGLEFALFQRLVPVYLLTFLYLKREFYGSSIEQRLERLVKDICIVEG